ncbi:hypothetical protein GJ744_005268 [Endocarpon pusillum]|uniref:Uncharacterized protein n=1 Tax=Endocarpon pusillum TaxID=364733 RepID=A0A8H7A4U7_9EURO|nr:hypothetical protein GJ744_005268 [Endocarpon pusillum]
MEPDRKILFLAELIHLAHLYSILDIASHKIERAFLEIEGLESHYHNCPLFFLEVGYYLQSEVMFMKAMEYIVGKGLLPIMSWSLKWTFDKASRSIWAIVSSQYREG